MITRFNNVDILLLPLYLLLNTKNWVLKRIEKTDP